MIVEIRPWGKFEMLAWEQPGFWVKKLTVMPGHATSLQIHHHRSEVWQGLRGEGHVQVGDDIRDMKPGKIDWANARVPHRIMCPFGSLEPLQVLEIARGEILTETDIERLEDQYGRT